MQGEQHPCAAVVREGAPWQIQAGGNEQTASLPVIDPELRAFHEVA